MIKIGLNVGFLIALCLQFSCSNIIEEKPTVYQTDGEWVIGCNLDRYNNRPIYINNTNAFILTGDKPLIRFVKRDKVLGNLLFSVSRNGKSLNICDFDQIESKYSAGQMMWSLTDQRFNDLDLNLNVLPTASEIGMVLKIQVKNMKAEDKLTWSFGGEKDYPNRQLSFDFDAMGYPEILNWKEVANNVEESLYNETNKPIDKNPLFLGFHLNSVGDVIMVSGEEAEQAYKQAQNKLGKLVDRLKIQTPDPYLNTIARASVVAVDGTWYPPIFVHGCMIFNHPYPGWRTIFGGTMYGWHDRVLDEAKHYIETQVTESDKKEAKADPKGLLTLQHPDSRFYGEGRIIKNQKRYNMQSQFFDQLIEDYRWTSNPELIKVLRNALELHLKWILDCFDPDGDGVYESFLNSWPTDSQWYNGGGTAEETSYAYRGHLAARDMARNANDKVSEEYHNQMLIKIKKGFFEKLWITKKGHSGAYREQGGHGRLHENPWLYSIFLPVDAGLTSSTQAIESVYYSEWALQNDTMPYGGRQVWTSNWVPGIWSVREKWPGDNYGLALSYFQAGLPEDGWDILKGTFMDKAFDDIVPGNLGSHQGGTDFGDCVHTFSRTLVQGLFGYNPDYPNGKVYIKPQFPKDWDHASIELPDVKIAFKQKGEKAKYSFELTKNADVHLELPVQCSDIKNVILNGERVKWELIPGVGCSIVKIEAKQADKINLIIEQADRLPYYEPVYITGNVGEKIEIITKDAKIVSFEDPQEVIKDEYINERTLSAFLEGEKGYHTLITSVIVGNAPQYRVFRIKVNDPKGDAAEANRYVDSIPNDASWENIDIDSYFNADITAIYKQEYLSPRPNTVSVRIGTDGYSPWTFPIWKSFPPEIKTDNLKNLLKDGNCLMTPQGVPFLWSKSDRNIAFTSMWDNYPDKISFPVNKKGDAIYFLISGSTNVMQCQIANAVIHLNYIDGQTDSLELIPPINYWNLSTISSNAPAPGQGSRTDYTSDTDKFCMPKKLPETVQIGKDCRAMLLNLKLREDVDLESVSLETLSQEVVVGLLGITLMK